MRFVLSVAVFFTLLASQPAFADYSSAIEAYRNKDYETARVTLEPLAENGESRAQLVLGLIHHKGLGVSKNFEKAVSLYRAAADSGNRTAQNNLGVMYRRGDGIEKDPKEAFSLIWMAAMQGHPRAELNLSDMYRRGEGAPKDLILAYVWLEFAVTDLPKSGQNIAATRRAELVAEMSTDDVIRAERMAKALRAGRK